LASGGGKQREDTSAPGRILTAYHPYHHPGSVGDALDRKTAVAVRCDDCIGFHVKAVLEQGASEKEVTEVLGMAIYMGAGMGAGPSVMYASHALEAFSQFASAISKPPPRLPPLSGHDSPAFTRLRVERPLRLSRRRDEASRSAPRR
jgi:AhpD family alkylhydroperoxidase